jgi:hypothetical protein
LFFEHDPAQAMGKVERAGADFKYLSDSSLALN